MKKFLEISTRWVYTWPGWTISLFYILLWVNGSNSPAAILICLPVVLASLLFAIGRWQGCVPGIIFALIPVAEYLYEEYLVRVLGQVIYHRLNPLPFTAAVTAYYLFMAWRVYTVSTNKDKLFNVEIPDDSPINKLDLTK